MAGVWIRRAPVEEPYDPDVSTCYNETMSECPICFDTFPDTKRTVRRMTCGHVTCRNCFHKVLKSSTMSCPLCRRHLLEEKCAESFPDSKILGLFILNPNFYAVPGSVVLLRVFEPRYLYLVKQCIEQDRLFGIQPGLDSRQGVLVSVRRHRELVPEGHIILEGLIVGRYEAFDKSSVPFEDPRHSSPGLYWMKCNILFEENNITDNSNSKQHQSLESSSSPEECNHAGIMDEVEVDDDDAKHMD